MIVCNDIDAALQAVAGAGASAKKTVWCIAELSPGKTCFAFVSSDNVAQVIRKDAINEALGPISRDIPEEERNRQFNDRRTMTDLIAPYVGKQGLKNDTGHAEEKMILNWKSMLAHSADRGHRRTSAVTIYLSHTPCTPFDKAPSDNVPGYPRSCARKLQVLRREYSYIKNWRIYYQHKFGNYQLSTLKDLPHASAAEVHASQQMINADKLDNGANVYHPFTEDILQKVKLYNLA